MDMPDINDKVQEMIDFETDLYQPSREIKKLNKKKRKRTLTNVEVQPKKMKLSTVNDSKYGVSPKKVKLPSLNDAKLKKKKDCQSWDEIELTPDEIIEDERLARHTLNGSSPGAKETENLKQSATGK